MWKRTDRPAACGIWLACGVAIASAAACRPVASGPQPLSGDSAKYLVTGEFSVVPMARIDRIQVTGGHLVLEGQPGPLTEPLPPDLDQARPTRHWALVSDAHVDGRHLFVFTEAETVTDFSLSLPDGDAPLHFDAFATAAGGGEVMVFASGDAKTGPGSFWGWVRIRTKS